MSFSVPFSLASGLLASEGRMIVVIIVFSELVEALIDAQVPDWVVF